VTGLLILYLAIGATLAWDNARSVTRHEPDLAWCTNCRGFVVVAVFWLPLLIGAVVVFLAERRRG